MFLRATPSSPVAICSTAFACAFLCPGATASVTVTSTYLATTAHLVLRAARVCREGRARYPLHAMVRDLGTASVADGSEEFSWCWTPLKFPLSLTITRRVVPLTVGRSAQPILRVLAKGRVRSEWLLLRKRAEQAWRLRWWSL